MTLLHIEGFDGYDSSTFQARYYVKGSPIIETTVYRNGRAAARCSYNVYFGWGFPGGTPSDSETIIGFAWRTSAIAVKTIVAFCTSTLGIQCQVRLNGGGYLEFLRGTTTILDTGSIQLAVDTWYYIEIKCKISNSITSGDCVVKINGVADITLATATDTETYSGSALDILLFTSSAIGSYGYYDDLYICDNQGSVNNDFLGDCIVACLRPDGNGNSAEWDGSDGNQVNNYQLVDDTTPDASSTYLEAQAASELDLFTYDDLSGVGTIHGLLAHSEAIKIGAGDLKLRNVCRSNSIDYNGDTEPVGEGNYCAVNHIWEIDPNTSAAWLEAGVNAAEFGMEAIT